MLNHRPAIYSHETEKLKDDDQIKKKRKKKEEKKGAIARNFSFTNATAVQSYEIRTAARA